MTITVTKRDFWLTLLTGGAWLFVIFTRGRKPKAVFVPDETAWDAD